jgi:FAD:protein FMN transferase
MGPLDRDLAQRRGRRKVDAMKRRTGQLRRRVVATAIVGFVLLWTVVFVQMATGNDPALGTGPVARAMAKKKRALERRRHSRQTTPPPPSEEADEESAPVEEPETSEPAAIEVEQAEAERAEAEQIGIEEQEAEQRAAEVRELEELEAVVSNARRTFDCFGGVVNVSVLGPASMEPEKAAAAAEAMLLDAHRQLSRFLPDSELSRLNRDPRTRVPADPLLLRLLSAAREAGELTSGVVDATLLGQIEAAGYRESMRGGLRAGPPPEAGAVAPAGPSPARSWAKLSVDGQAGAIERPPGVEIDSGGIAKGLLADDVAARLARFPAYAVDCCGDARIGGTAERQRLVRVEDPFGGEPICSLEVSDGGVATSGITRRSWKGAGGASAHHLLDPATGKPAFTGVVQATALAPSAFLADVHAKWALLSGPELAPSRLPYGGVLVLAGGGVETVVPRTPIGTVA